MINEDGSHEGRTKRIYYSREHDLYLLTGVLEDTKFEDVFLAPTQRDDGKKFGKHEYKPPYGIRLSGSFNREAFILAVPAQDLGPEATSFMSKRAQTIDESNMHDIAIDVTDLEITVRDLFCKTSRTFARPQEDSPSLPFFGLSQ